MSDLVPVTQAREAAVERYLNALRDEKTAERAVERMEGLMKQTRDDHSTAMMEVQASRRALDQACENEAKASVEG